MKEFFGVLMIDTTEVVLRIYQKDDKQWRLHHYADKDLIDFRREKTISPYDIAEVIADFFSDFHSQSVIEWKICVRNSTKENAAQIALAIGQRIEFLGRQREQELISKGLFTEMW